MILFADFQFMMNAPAGNIVLLVGALAIEDIIQGLFFNKEVFLYTFPYQDVGTKWKPV